MSRSFIVPGNFVRKSGDGMTGDLAMAPGKKVDGIDLSEVKETKIKVGFYDGDGNDDRNINIGVDLASKNNVVVIIKVLTAAVGYAAMFRVEMGQGENAYFFDAQHRMTDTIQALTSTGFQIGSGVSVNNAAYSYLYIVFWEEP